MGPELAFEAKIYYSDLAVRCMLDVMSAVGVESFPVFDAKMGLDSYHRSSFDSGSVLPKLLNDAMLLPLLSGGNVGVRRRRLELLWVTLKSSWRI
jgi:butyryl-CoA dehydrogenase